MTRTRPTGAGRTCSTFIRSRQERRWTAQDTRIGRENIVMRSRNISRRSRLGEVQPRRRSVRGFTLIELMIVMTIIMILASMAAVHYDKSVTRAKEAALHHDLSV